MVAKANLESADREKAAEVIEKSIIAIGQLSEVGSIVLFKSATVKLLTDDEMKEIGGPPIEIKTEETKKSKKNFLKKYGPWIGGVVILGIIINQNQNQDNPKPENLPPVPVE